MMLCSRAYLLAFVLFLRVAVLRAGFAAGAASAGFSSALAGAASAFAPADFAAVLAAVFFAAGFLVVFFTAGAAFSSTGFSSAGAAASALTSAGFSSALGACFARSFTSEMVHSWSSPQSPARSGAQRRPQYPCPRCRCTCRQPTWSAGGRCRPGWLHLPHLGSAAHVLPQVEPGAVCGAGHHQVDELAGGAVADTVNAVALADESPLLLGLALVLAQTDVAAVLDALHT